MILRALVVIRRIPVGHPLPHVARHVVQLERIGRIAADRRGAALGLHAGVRKKMRARRRRACRPRESACPRGRRAPRAPTRLRLAAAPACRSCSQATRSRRLASSNPTSVTGWRSRPSGGVPLFQKYAAASERKSDSSAPDTISGSARIAGDGWPVSRTNCAYSALVTGQMPIANSSIYAAVKRDAHPLRRLRRP